MSVAGFTPPFLGERGRLHASPQNAEPRSSSSPLAGCLPGNQPSDKAEWVTTGKLSWKDSFIFMEDKGVAGLGKHLHVKGGCDHFSR